MKFLTLLLISVTPAFAAGPLYPTTPPASELIAAARERFKDIVYPKQPGDLTTSVTKLRNLPVAPPATDNVEEALAELEEHPFREVEEIVDLPGSVADVVGILEEKPFRKMGRLPELLTPRPFDFKLAFEWAPPKSQFMVDLLKQIQAAKEAGDTVEYERLTQKYAAWADYEN